MPTFENIQVTYPDTRNPSKNSSKIPNYKLIYTQSNVWDAGIQLFILVMFHTRDMCPTFAPQTHGGGTEVRTHGHTYFRNPQILGDFHFQNLCFPFFGREYALICVTLGPDDITDSKYMLKTSSVQLECH